MKNRIGFLPGMALGLFLGATLTGTAWAAIVNLSPSTTKLVVDGQPVAVTGYNVDSRNYFQLMELAQVFDVSLSWDGATDTAYLDSGTVATPASTAVKDMLNIETTEGKHYVTVTNSYIPGKLSNGQAITEKNMLAMLAEIEAIFPDGTDWGQGPYYYRTDTYNRTACTGFAYMVRDILFGKGASFTTHSDLASVKCGDVVRLYNNATNDEHWVVVMESGSDTVGYPTISTCEGNNNGQVIWNSSTTVSAYQYLYPNTMIHSFY